ncbi:hypothetical protein BJV77DRAFT_961042 [Russula vinacea]|nr:hypothetical protein BJV77DRAFT_961042 [Russula vinacea]
MHRPRTQGLQLACPYAECEAKLGRWQDWGRHILCHLPDCFCCPAPDCPYRGHRKEMLNMHISNSKGKCGSKPKSEEVCMIYDAKLITQWIREDTVSIEIAEMLALNFVKQRAKELGKVNGNAPRNAAFDLSTSFLLDLSRRHELSDKLKEFLQRAVTYHHQELFEPSETRLLTPLQYAIVRWKNRGQTLERLLLTPAGGLLLCAAFPDDGIPKRPTHHRRDQSES